MEIIGNQRLHSFVPTTANNSVSTNKLENSSHQPDGDLPAVSELECNSAIESPASLLGTIPEIQVKIGKYLEIRDFLRLGQTNRKLNEVMSRGMSDYTTSIRAPKILTAEVIAVLSKIRNLDLRVSYATEENTV